MELKRKTYTVAGHTHSVVLVKDGEEYIVKVDGEIYKKTPNELYAVQTFNAI